MLLSIRVGEQEKQIVAGIRGHYTPDELVGRQIVVVNNLEEAVLRGEESQGMLLAASDGDAVVLLRPDRDCEPGSAVK
jgi:methionyl-tRNA synthetase